MQTHLRAGRKLDMLVADRVMGLFVLSGDILPENLPVGFVVTPQLFARHVIPRVMEGEISRERALELVIPRYSDDMEYLVERRMQALGFALEEKQEDGKHLARFVLPDQGEFWSTGDTRAEAVCLAALKAVERYEWENPTN